MATIKELQEELEVVKNELEEAKAVLKRFEEGEAWWS